jgi:hypothetical protein
MMKQHRWCLTNTLFVHRSQTMSRFDHYVVQCWLVDYEEYKMDYADEEQDPADEQLGDN